MEAPPPEPSNSVEALRSIEEEERKVKNAQGLRGEGLVRRGPG